MKTRCCLLYFILISFLYLPALCYGDQLTTKNYVITITRHCQEGEVTCDKVTYHGISKKTQHALTLSGHTLHTLCADGVTPCQFLGYEFKTGKTTYFVLETGLLRVVKDDNKVLVEEQGEWEY